MKQIFGVIDVGSNTVKLSVYKVENNEIWKVFNRKTMAGLVSYVDEDGFLSKKGISKAISVLNEIKRVLNEVGVKNVYPFATASLRNIVNTKEAVEKIKNGTGFELDVLTGKQEAILGYKGATHCLGPGIKDGIMVDIGGGSTELVYFTERKIHKAVSMPIGSLNLYSKYVKRIIPIRSEIITMKKVVDGELDKIGNAISKNRTICGVGGTICAASKLSNATYGIPASKKTLQIENVRFILNAIGSENKDIIDSILKIIPERVNTIIPGMTILRTISDRYECKTVYVSKYGVREGYLLNKLISGGVMNE